MERKLLKSIKEQEEEKTIKWLRKGNLYAKERKKERGNKIFVERGKSFCG
jgi:hypothetical protein